jgi:membrane glycosyltransferase
MIDSLITFFLFLLFYDRDSIQVKGGLQRLRRKLAVLPHQKEPHMIADQTNKQTSETRTVWDQFFCAALIAESNLTAPVVGGATHEDRQNLLIERAKALADKMMENRR